MNTNKNITSSFDGGFNLPIHDQVLQVRMQDEMARSMKTDVPTLAVQSECQQLKISNIRTDGDTRVRIDVNPWVAADYARLMNEGIQFPPIIVFYDGTDYWLADGFYRLAATIEVGRKEVPTIVHNGTQREARLFAITANRSHGARYTTKDKQNAFLTLVQDEEWRNWSNNEKARQIGVSEGSIRNYQKNYDKTQEHAGTSKNTNMRVCRRGNKIFAMNVTGQSAKGAPKNNSGVPRKILAIARDLDFVDDPRQVDHFLAQPEEDWEPIANILRKSKYTARMMSVNEAVLALRWNLRTRKNNQSLEDRRDLALKSNTESKFLCGDCTDDEVLKHLQPQSVRLLLADGPYGIGYTSSSDYRDNMATIPNDGSLKSALKIHREMLEKVAPKMMPDCHIMLFCDKQFEPEFRQVLLEAGYEYKDSLIWDKDDAGRPIPNGAMRRHERILWFTKGHLQLAGSIADVLRHERPSKAFRSSDGTHLTPKPESLLRELISATTVENELVFDPFAGTASTLVAAKKLGRRSFGTEYKEKWYKVGMARLAELEPEILSLEKGSTSPSAANTFQEVDEAAA